MQKLVLRKLVAIILIVSMIITTGGFATLADSISDVIETTKNESADETDLSHKYYDDLVGASDNVEASDNVGASTASPSFADDEDIENDEEQDSNTYEEEPEEDENAETEGANETVETSTDNVGARTVSPDDETVEASDNVGASTASPSFAEEDTEDDVIDNNDINISTPSEEIETNLNIASESSINTEDVSNEVISTTSDLTLATLSDVYSEDLLFGSIASESEISLASLSEISVIMDQSLLGSAGTSIKGGQHIYFGNYKQANANATDPISWTVLTVEDGKAFLLSDYVLEPHIFSTYTTTYSISEIKEYLDNTFYNTAFNEDERSAIAAVYHEDTHSTDKVFLPSKEELLRYFWTRSKSVTPDVKIEHFYDVWNLAWGTFQNMFKDSDNFESLICKATAYAFNETRPYPLHCQREQGGDYRNASYWTRTPRPAGLLGNYLYVLNWQKKSLDFGAKARPESAWTEGIRPCVWINLESSYFINNRSNITFDFNDRGHYYGPYDPRAGFQSESQYKNFNSYVEGVKTQLPTMADVVTPGEGLELAGWIYNSNQTEPRYYITPDTRGEITAKAVWRLRRYKITYDLTDDKTGLEGSWNGNPGPSYHEVNNNTYLATNVIGPPGREFDYWTIDGKYVWWVDINENRDVTVKAVYKNKKYNINYDLTDDVTSYKGTLDGKYPTEYEYSVGIDDLPINVNAPIGRAFDHWEVNGVATTSIATDTFGDITLKASYIDVIWLGTFPQSDKTGVQQEPIKWRVVSRNGNEALLVADKIMYTDHFTGSPIRQNWNNSDIRNWLNNSFKDGAFTLAQKNDTIINKTLPTRMTSETSIDNSENIFLLSEEETIAYFTNKDSLRARATEYAKTHADGHSITIDDSGCSPYWLRSRIYGQYQDIVNTKGYADRFIAFNNFNTGIRPAFYLNLSSDIYRSSNNSIILNLNGGSFKKESKLWDEFTTYQGGQKLPDASNIVPPGDETFLGWVIRGENNFISEIPVNQTGDIILDAVYASIWFGTYPQGDKTGVEEEPIKWKIVKKEGNEVLLVSDKVLDNVSYHNTRTNVNWEDSDMRSWLDSSFKNRAFTTVQINDGIITKTISNGTDQPQTQDKLFLLSTDEAYIFSSDKERMSKGTEYAKNINYDGMHIFNGVDGYTRYWLRTRHSWARAFAVEERGTISYGNYAAVYFNSKNYGVRPAFYANFNSSMFRLSNNRVTWDLNGGRWKEGSKLWGEMTSYQGGQKLPTAVNLIPPENQEFLGWSYVGETATISEIEPDKTGGITLVAQWSDHPYNITWDFMDLSTGVRGDWVGTPGPSTYTYGVGLPTLPTNATSNNAYRIFDHFYVINGTTPSCITTKDTGDKIISAIYRNINYDIDWDLEDGNTGNFGTWDGEHPDTYEHSVGLMTLPTNVIGPNGRELDHWEIDGQVATSISNTAQGTIIVKAVYKNRIYNITWVLGEGKWKNINPDMTYEYGIGAILPNANLHIEMPAGRRFSRWLLKFEGDSSMHESTIISAFAYGDVEVIAEYVNETYNLTYQDEYGNPITWTGGVAGPATYTYQTGIPYFPRNVEAVGENEFDHWEINNLIVTGIAPTAYGDKVVIAIYKKKTYKITWHLDDILGQVGDWNGEAGKDTYTYGTEYILPTNITPPKATEFAGWTSEEYGLIATTCITKYDTGDKDFYAFYEPVHYNITWSLNGASIDESTYDRDDWYTYQMLLIPNGRIPLPLASQIINIPTGKEFSHWAINGVRATAIEPGTIGDITITLVLKGEDEHNITWDYGIGDDHWEFDGWIPPATFSEGIPVTIPDDSYLHKTPNGREIDYFTVNGVKTNVIDGDSDVVVTATLKDITYRIKYNLGDGSWDGEEGETTYTHGTPYTLPMNIIPPRGQQFDHWEINGVATTSIMPTDYGHKEFTAIYEIGTYKIYWYLGSSTVNYVLPEEYTYGAEVQLPTETQIRTSDGREFDYWTVNGVRTTKIDSSFAENVAVAINYISYSITWEFGGGRVPYYYLSSIYEKGVGLKLPLESDIIPPTNYTFDYFTVNGGKATEISTTQVGNVVVKAVYKNSPSPSPSPSPKPTPYYPGGGGSGGGGGGGGGGIPMPTVAINTTYLNQLKIISQIFNADQIIWVYDPVTNKFKMNVDMGDGIISAVDGFYIVNGVKNQNENGATMQMPTNATYCFKDGNMLTGWIKTIDEKWYFFENAKNANEGQMVYGWKQIDGKWYYFTTDGSMLTNALTPDGRTVGADGAVIVV